MKANNKNWYAKMFSKVKELLEYMVEMEASCMGMIELPVDEEKVIVGWNSKTIKVTCGDLDFTMPMAWFLNDEEIRVVTNTALEDAQQRIKEDAPRRIFPSVTQPSPSGGRSAVMSDEERGEPDAYETVGDSGMLGAPVRPQPGVPSVADLIGDAGD